MKLFLRNLQASTSSQSVLFQNLILSPSRNFGNSFLAYWFLKQLSSLSFMIFLDLILSTQFWPRVMLWLFHVQLLLSKLQSAFVELFTQLVLTLPCTHSFKIGILVFLFEISTWVLVLKLIFLSSLNQVDLKVIILLLIDQLW